ncbi:MAG: 30S ribosomal protein S8e [Thaumarchaeota archaeon]|jgi:small subunit ribosomal protein S8e|nr:30S ribosomal protein S8e [Nitrososphaerota archaeon]
MVKAIENLAKRKMTGGRRVPNRARRSSETDGYPVETSLGQQLVRLRRVRGASIRVVLRSTEYANVVDPRTNKTVKSKILKVLGNTASRDYQRRGVLTKGAMIETEAGKAKVISRPSQHGVINALVV